jgi:asparagine synthase (glutamine-hydrolysing)
MCGFAGFLGNYSAGAAFLDAMGRELYHRGPDDAGLWTDPDADIALAFRRLSIIDLSSAGHQPMHSAHGRFVLVFNGEIYNHSELRAELEKSGSAPAWRGHADTETLLAGFEAWGVEATVQRTVGMFAFALWDRETRTLTLGRDRLGEKPLYYGWQQGVLLFGSELKALRAHPAFRAEIDREALALLMRHNYIPAPYSIYRGIGKLIPGTLVKFSLNKQAAEPEHYWDARNAITEGLAQPFAGSPADAVEELRKRLRESIRGQMIADVPLGAFLSGGIDSSTVVAVMQELSSRPVRTFSIGFQEDGYNEAVYAKQVAAHLGTDHTELYVSPEQAREVIPLLPSIYCEPFSDSSQIPTYLVSRLARQHVTVSLSGDAGDELFAGYHRYALSQRYWQTIARVPTGLRSIAARGIRSVPAATWTRLLNPFRDRLQGVLNQSTPGERLIRAAEMLASRDSTDLYLVAVSHWNDPAGLVLADAEHATVLTNKAIRPRADHFVHEMMALDLLSYLPDDILVKVDRAAMAVSLETRVPFLDHRIVEFAWSLPLDYKLRNGVTKWPVRELLYSYVPRELVERPKMGFGVPIDHWLRGPLRDWAEDLLDENRLRSEGYFQPEPIRRKWHEHLSGRYNWHYHLWDVLMFQAWLAQQSPASTIRLSA